MKEIKECGLDEILKDASLSGFYFCFLCNSKNFYKMKGSKFDHTLYGFMDGKEMVYDRSVDLFEKK